MNVGVSADKEDSSNSGDLLELVAKALYEHKIKEARAAVADLELPLQDIELTLIEVRDCADDRCAAITIFALMEDIMMLLLTRNMNSKLKGGLGKIFEPSGILGTASSRITMAAALGWISKETQAQLDLLRKIRNEFAHSVTTRRLTDSPVSGWISSMHASESMFESGAAAARKVRPQYTVRPIKSYSTRQKLVARGATLLRQLVFELTALPHAHRHGVAAEHIFGDMDEMPKAAADLLRSITRIMLPILIDNFDHDEFERARAG